MLYKKQKSPITKWLKRGVTVLIAGEAILFFGSYGLWYFINQKREFRKYLHENYPTVLEGYYKLGETFDSNNRIREIDYAYWRTKAKSH